MWGFLGSAHGSLSVSIVPSAPPALYPNLAELEDYMGLALSSEEIQKNLFPDSSTVGCGPGVPSHSHILPGEGTRRPSRADVWPHGPADPRPHCRR